jgi:small conductance mechanosensitive channel
MLHCRSTPRYVISVRTDGRTYRQEHERLMNEMFTDIAGELGSDALALGRVLFQIAVIIAIAWLVSVVARRQIEPLLSRRSVGRNGALLVGRLVSIAAFIGALIAILSRLGANMTGLLTFLGAFTVAIGLAIQDVLKNFFSGIFLLVERPFRVGDRIRIRDVEGEIQGIDVRTTLVRNSEGALVLIPNAIMFTEILTNRSHFRTRRLDLTITAKSLSIGDVERTLVDTLSEITGVRKPIPAPLVYQASADGRAMEISLLIETDPAIERTVMRTLVESLGDSTIEVRK